MMYMCLCVILVNVLVVECVSGVVLFVVGLGDVICLCGVFLCGV